MGIADLFGSSDPVQKRLEGIYLPVYRMMGMSPPQAMAHFRESYAHAQQAVANGGGFVVPPGHGSNLLTRESSDPNVAAYLRAIRAESVKNADIIWFWDMPNIERVMMMNEFESQVMAMVLSEMRAGRSPEQAWGTARQFHPYYGDPRDTTSANGDARPIPFELKDRVDRYIERRFQSDQDNYRNELMNSKTFNALIRSEIKAGRI